VHRLAVADFRLVLQACVVVLMQRAAHFDALGLEDREKTSQAPIDSGKCGAISVVDQGWPLDG
jgi:hypothetical protein